MPEPCVHILLIIPIGEVPHTKGLTALPKPHICVMRETGTVGKGLLGHMQPEYGKQEEHGDLSPTCFSSQHMPFQEADNQAVPRGPGTVGCRGGDQRGWRHSDQDGKWSYKLSLTERFSHSFP